MTMSRMTVLVIAMAAPAGAAAPGPTAEEALAKYRETFMPTPILECPPTTNPDEIVVCGRADAVNPHRLPLPSQRVPGERIAMIAGESPRATTGIGGCMSRCHQPVAVNPLIAIPFIIKGIKKIIRKEY